MIDVALYLRKARRAGNFSVELIAADLEARLRKDVTLRVVRSPFLSGGVFKRLGTMLHAALCVRARLLHVVGDINFAVLFARRRRVVLTMLDCVFLRDTRGMKRRVLKLLWLDLPLRSAGAVVTISHAMAAEIRRESGLALPQMTVIPVAIAREFQARPKVFDAARPRILQVGTASNKNVMRLAEALAGVPCKLTIVGVIDLALRETLARGNVEFEQFDRLEFAALVEQYEKTDVVAFVSTYEGFGMPVIEAQTVERVVVAGDIPVLREVAGEGAAFAPVADVAEIRAAFLRVIGDAAWREALIAKGRENARRFAPEAIAAQYLAVYRAMLGGG